MPLMKSVNDHHLSELFSLVFSIDEDLRICDPSATALRHMPQLDDHPALDSVFTPLRPRDIKSFQDAMKSAGSLILMISRIDSYVSNFDSEISRNDSGDSQN